MVETLLDGNFAVFANSVSCTRYLMLKKTSCMDL